MATVEWKSFDVVAMGKIYAVIGAIMGVIMGIMMAAFGAMMTAVPGVAGIGVGFGLLSIIILPIMYAIGGFIMGIITAFIYNIVAGWVGGIKVNTG